MATGRPCKGPRGFPDNLQSSASLDFSRNDFLSKKAQAWTFFSNSSILSIKLFATSTDESSLFLILSIILS